MHAEYTEQTKILTEITPPIEYGSGVGTKAIGVVLYAAGVDFSGLSQQDCQAMNVQKATDLFMDTNYRRWRLIRKHVAQGLADIRGDWQAVALAKDRRLKGLPGSIVHYLTHLNYENEPGQTTAQQE